MSSAAEERIFNWGAVTWCLNMGLLALGNELEHATRAICCHGGRTTSVSVPNIASKFSTWSRESCQQWELIGSLTAWFTWRAWCTRLFVGWAVPPADQS
eukprot:c2764_g1_i1 orf=3-296(-)